MSHYNMTRRAALGAFASLAVCSGLKSKRDSDTTLRLVHLTDAHVNVDGPSCDGFAKCLEDIKTVSPDLILNGGDSISDAFDTSFDHAKAQWSNWNDMVKELTIPIRHCLGNHDVRKDGKALALQALGLNNPYYSFEQAGWKFIVLDSTYIFMDKYIGQLEDDQFNWLSKELNTHKPILILSHIPILSCCAYYDGINEHKTYWSVPGKWMHIDSRKIKDLFYKSGNVKLCLSGHIHLQDRVDYLGTTYICGGAVSGAWWNGANQECERGYGVVDLRADGTFSYRYLNY